MRFRSLELGCDAAKTWHITDRLNPDWNQFVKAATSDESILDSRIGAGRQCQGARFATLAPRLFSF